MVILDSYLMNLRLFKADNLTSSQAEESMMFKKHCPLQVGGSITKTNGFHHFSRKFALNSNTHYGTKKIKIHIKIHEKTSH